MARGNRRAKRGGFLSGLFGLINPIRDPSLLIAVILTVIWQGSTPQEWWRWALFGLLNWIAVKAVIWLLVNFAFSFVYLLRKGFWVLRNPRLAWRLLDALGTEEIIIGGLRPDMFATEDGQLHPGQLGVAMAPYGGYAPQITEDPYPYDGYNGNSRAPMLSERLDAHGEEMQQALSSYSRLLADWMGFTEEKWRAISDSQLGWKPLRGRWNGWDEIYRDSYGADDRTALTASDPMARRFDGSQSKGSAASSVACFLRDLDQLRQAIAMINGEESPAPRMGGMSQQGPRSTRTGKAPIIRNPMIVDADQP
jgi:hypothetical protein